MTTDDLSYFRTVKIPILESTSKKAGKINRAMKDYRLSRQLAIDYFREHGTDEFGYSERESLRKQISSHDGVNLPARTIYPAITTAQQNYEQYENGEFDREPSAHRSDVLRLERQDTYLFHSADRYYLNVATGCGKVTLPLRVSDDDYHQNHLPDASAIPDSGRRPGVPFADLDPGAFPNNTVKLSTSTLHRSAERVFTANLLFQCNPNREPSDRVRNLVGVDRGRNQLAAAAVYDKESDHVVDWYNHSGDEVEHYMDRFSERIEEIQQNRAWMQMSGARQRRRAYTRQTDYEIANRIVDLAREHQPAAIVLEDLSGMSRLGNRDGENRRFSEWSYSRLGEYIRDKASPYSIPVWEVDPKNTSQQCSRCGSQDTHRDSVHFRCRECGYEQHADANAAVNIARRGAENMGSLPTTGRREATSE